MTPGARSLASFTAERRVSIKSGSRHLVDPELAALLERFPGARCRTRRSRRCARVRHGRRSHRRTSPAQLLRCDPSRGADSAQDIQIYVHQPHAFSRSRGCILHIHGGGFVAGDASRHEADHRHLLAELGVTLVSVTYRLAPETRFPGAVQDCYAALAWIFASAAELGVDPARVGLMGESAGGGLAASLALLARDRGEYRLAFQNLFYPMIDDRTCVMPDPNPMAGEFAWTAQDNFYAWSALLGEAPGGPDVSLYAAAARAPTVSGPPPAFLATAALDLFLDENLTYARRLSRAGVSVEVHVYPGAFHGFHVWPHARVSVQARRDSVSALQRALTATPT